MEPLGPGQPGDFEGGVDGDAEPAQPERLESASPVAVPRVVRRVVIGVAVGGAALILAVALLGESLGRSASTPGAVESPSPSASSTPVTFPSPRQPTPTPPRPAVFGSSGFLADLDVVVYARSARALFRIDTAAGRVTRTPTESLDAVESVTLLALSDRVLVGPWDDSAGYVVVDGQSPRRLRGQLAGGGQYFPGPSGRVWTISSTVANGKLQVTLTDKTGRAVYATFEISSTGTFYPDGAGGLFWEDIGGTYQATASGLRRVTRGKVLATSRTAFLATECDRRFACGTYAYDRTSGNRRRVGPAVAERNFPGALSPDGRHAAMQRWESTPAPSLAVIEVGSGKEVASFPLLEDSYNDPSAVWLPDGRLVFLRESRLAVFDPRTKQVAPTSLRLPGLIQLAVRQPAG